MTRNQPARRPAPEALVAVVLAGLTTGNELGTLIAVHPALSTLGHAEHIAAEQAVSRRVGAMMAPLMAATVTATTVSAVRCPSGPGRRAFWASAGCFGTMLALTFAGNLPANVATLHAGPDTSPAEWRALRQRWDRLHRARVALDVAGAVLAAHAAQGLP